MALTHVLDYVAEHGHYPAGKANSMRKVLDAYSRDRTLALMQVGIPAFAVQRYTETSAAKLARWLDEDAAKTEDTVQHFDKWLEELGSDENPS